MLKSGSAFGETMLLHKRFQRVSGFTKRIAELFEALEKDDNDDSNDSNDLKTSRKDIETQLDTRIVGDHIEFIDLTIAAPSPPGSQPQQQDQKEDHHEKSNTTSSNSTTTNVVTNIKRLLVKNLTLAIPPGRNIMVR